MATFHRCDRCKLEIEPNNPKLYTKDSQLKGAVPSGYWTDEGRLSNLKVEVSCIDTAGNTRGDICQDCIVDIISRSGSISRLEQPQFKQTDIPKQLFTKGQRVSFTDKGHEYIGTVADDSEPTGYTTVLWDGLKKPDDVYTHGLKLLHSVDTKV